MMLPLSSMKSMVFHGDLMDCTEVSAATGLQERVSVATFEYFLDVMFGPTPFSDDDHSDTAEGCPV